MTSTDAHQKVRMHTFTASRKRSKITIRCVHVCMYHTCCMAFTTCSGIAMSVTVFLMKHTVEYVVAHTIHAFTHTHIHIHTYLLTTHTNKHVHTLRNEAYVEYMLCKVLQNTLTIHAFSHTHTHTHTHTYMHTHTYTEYTYNTCILTHTYTYTYTYTYIHKYTHMHACIHIYTHIHKHTTTHIHKAGSRRR
jgi:hypothetical protein